MRVGIIGLPNSGKTTIFNIITKSSAEVAPYPFTTKDKNIGIMIPPIDMERLARMLNSSKVTYPQIEVWDVAGLIKGAHKGEGLGNEFLSYIRPLDCVCFVLREFDIKGDEKIPPKDAFEILRYEIGMSDLGVIKKEEEKLKKRRGDREVEKKLKVIEDIKAEIERFAREGMFFIKDDMETIVKQFGIISAKPYFIILNTDLGESDWERLKSGFSGNVYVVDALSQYDMEEEEVKRFTRTVREVFFDGMKKSLNLITFFTGFEGEELRAYIVKRGTTVYDGAGLIHSDIQKGFISAEIFSAKDDYQTKKVVGRDYLIEDGDLVRIKFK